MRNMNAKPVFYPMLILSLSGDGQWITKLPAMPIGRLGYRVFEKHRQMLAKKKNAD